MTPPATIRPGWLHRHRSRLSLLTVALLSALLAGWTTWEHAGRQGADFGYAVRAAAWLVQGDDPYERMDPNAEIGYGGPLLYPLPAAVLYDAWHVLGVAGPARR